MQNIFTRISCCIVPSQCILRLSRCVRWLEFVVSNNVFVWVSVTLSTSQKKVVTKSEDEYGTEYNGAPIEVYWVNTWCWWESQHDNEVRTIHKRNGVRIYTPSTKRPSRSFPRISPHLACPYRGEMDQDIGGIERHKLTRDNRIKCDRRAEVDADKSNHKASNG